VIVSLIVIALAGPLDTYQPCTIPARVRSDFRRLRSEAARPERVPEIGNRRLTADLSEHNHAGEGWPT
jgi:hypothetical protein